MKKYDFTYRHIDVTAREQMWDIDPDSYEYYSHAYCNICGRGFVIQGRSNIILGEHLRGCLSPEEDAFEEDGPMMNYLWKVDSEKPTEEITKNLHGLAVCFVEFYDSHVAERGFALSGGGMDLSDDLILAYARNGWAPPAVLRIPDFAGNRLDEDKKLEIAAVKESQKAMLQRAKSSLNDVISYENKLKREDKDGRHKKKSRN